MTADFRLTAFAAGGAEVRRTGLDHEWVSELYTQGFALRTADTLATCLAKVVALSDVEVAKVNAAVRLRVAARPLASSLEHLRARALRCCDDVAALIEWAGARSYYGPWFVVESADID